MVPTAANGQPAAAGYRRGADGSHPAYGVVVLTVSTTGIARIVVFGDPGLLGRFGLPATATGELAAAGATVIAEPTRTPWASLNARLEAPAGLQLTLFTDNPQADDPA